MTGLGQVLFWSGLAAFVTGVILLGRIARPSAAVLPELPAIPTFRVWPVASGLDDAEDADLHAILTDEGIVVDIYKDGEHLDTWAMTAQEFADYYFPWITKEDD